MIVTIHQPQYLTWCGFFNKCACSDMAVLLDDVQFQKNGFQNRTKIKTATGWQYLTVPVSYNHPARISEVRISSNVDWQKKHWKALLQNYQKAPYFHNYEDKIKPLFENRFDRLEELVDKSIRIIFDILRIDVPVVKSSSIEAPGDRSDRLVNICKALKADTYLSGIGGKNYLEEDKFNDAGIHVIYQDYKHPVYEQQFKEGPFQPNMSALDLIFNCGEKSRDIVLSGYKLPEIEHFNAKA